MDFTEFLNEWRNGEDFIIVNTSGSTGTPKTVRLNKKFVKESAQRTINFFSIVAGSRLHSCVSPDFIGGKMMGVRAEIAGANLTWENPSNKPLQNSDKDDKIDLLAVVPSQMEFISEQKDSLPEIRNIIVGGAPIPLKLRKKIVESRLNAYETYGMTETASHIALRKISADNIPFKTLPGITVSTDEEGALKILFDDGKMFQTNDIAEIHTPTEFFIIGRRDNIINTGGKKVNPLEIENKISQFIPSPFLITGFPDDKWGEKIVLIIETADYINKDEIKDKCRLILPGWMVPKEIVTVNKLPLTANGKIRRPKSLEDLFSSLF